MTTEPTNAGEIERLRERVGELETAVRLREKVIRGDSARLSELTEKFEDLVRQRDARIADLERERDEAKGHAVDMLLRAEKAEAETTEKCASIVDGCRMTGRAPIGPLYGAGWNSAIQFVAEKIRAAKAALDASQAPAQGREG